MSGNRVRIKFEKCGILKFVGHLDTMRYFQKAIRRADIPASYSQGFHPHMLLSFALPLGVGVTTEGDYMELILDSDISSKDAIARLNEQMVSGVKIHSFKYMPEKSKKAMAAVEAASYRVTLNDYDGTDYSDRLRSFYDKSDEIIIIKKTKNSERSIDLKPLIHKFTYNGNGTFDILLSAGSTDNIKPQLVFDAFLGEDAQISIHRIDLLTRTDDGNLISLDDIGKDK